MPRSRRLCCGSTLIVLALFSCRADGPEPGPADEPAEVKSTALELVAWIEEGRRLSEQFDPMPMRPTELLQLPDSIDFFTFGLPTAIDAKGVGTCRIVAADASDDAVHMFGLDGSFVETLYGGIADTSLISNVTAVSLHGRTLAVADLSQQTVSEYEGFVTHVGTQHVPTPLPGALDQAVFGSEIALVGNGVWAEHWIESSRLISPPVVSYDDTPIVRVWRHDTSQFLGRGHGYAAAPEPSLRLLTKAGSLYREIPFGSVGGWTAGCLRSRLVDVRAVRRE